MGTGQRFVRLNHGKMRLWALCGVALAVSFAFTASDVGAKSKVKRIQFLSESLSDKRDVFVYLPAAYAKDEKARFPVVFALHGLGGNGEDFFTHGKMKSHLDSLIRSKKLRPVIVVAPNGDNGYWTNHVHAKNKVGLRWADYVAKDLLTEIDGMFRTQTGREARALVGVSMGGYGAVSIGLQHPDKFHAVISLSGALFATPPGCRGAKLTCSGDETRKQDAKGPCTLTKPDCSGKLGRSAKRKHYAAAWGNPPDLSHWKGISPMELLAKLTPGSPLLPRIYLHCGAEDKRFHAFFKQANQLLAGNDILHQPRSVKKGRHTWKLWESETRRWLRWLESGWAGMDKAAVSPDSKANDAKSPQEGPETDGPKKAPKD